MVENQDYRIEASHYLAMVIDRIIVLNSAAILVEKDQQIVQVLVQTHSCKDYTKLRAYKAS